MRWTEEKKELQERKKREEALKNQGPVVGQEERDRIRERNMELERKKTEMMEEARERDRELRLKGDEVVVPLNANLYDHVPSRLNDQTESYIQRLKAVQESRGQGDGGEKYGVVPGNFADQVGLQQRYIKNPEWRQKLYG